MDHDVNIKYRFFNILFALISDNFAVRVSMLSLHVLLLIAEISVRPIKTVKTVNFVASIISSKAVKLFKDMAYDADRKYG